MITIAGMEERTGMGTGVGKEVGTGAGTGAEAGARTRTRIEMRVESGTRGGSEDARERATPTSNRQPQPQDPTSRRDRCIMLKIRAQGREARDRIGEGSGEAKKRRKPQKSCRRDVENGGDLSGNMKNINKKVVAQ